MEQSENIKDMSIYESSDFWDEHDFGEFDDVQEEKKGILHINIKVVYTFKNEN